MENNKPPSLLSVVWPPAGMALLMALIALVCLDVGLTALGSVRSQMRGDRIVDYQVDIVSRLSRIETAVAPPPPPEPPPYWKCLGPVETRAVGCDR